MLRRQASQLEEFIATNYESDEIVLMDEFMERVRASGLPHDVKEAAEELPPGEYSKQQLLHEVEGLPVYLHPAGPRGKRR